MKQTAIALHLLIFLTIPLASPVLAEDEVTVQVTSIVASAEGSPRLAARGASEAKKVSVDPKLAGFGSKLRSLFAYSRYSFLGRARSSTSFGDVGAFALPERFSLEVEPRRIDVADGEERIEMLVTLFREPPPRAMTLAEADVPAAGPEREIVLRTRIRLENGGTVLLGGPPIRDGVLILALSARR